MESVDTEPISSTAICEPKEMLIDGDYYMKAFFVTFEVEGRLFRVPSYHFFKESPDFVEVYKLSLHVTDGADPIKLEKVRQVDFRSLLKALYPLSVSLQLSLSKPEWISVLTLSSEWGFLRLRRMARDEMQRMELLTSVEKICLGRELRISSWVMKGFEELVERADTITDDEAIDLDSDFVTTVYKLFRMRELRIAGTLPSARQKVEEIFKEELERTRREEKGFTTKEEEEEIRMAEEKARKRAEEEARRKDEERKKDEAGRKKVRY